MHYQIPRAVTMYAQGPASIDESGIYMSVASKAAEYDSLRLATKNDYRLTNI